MIISIFGLLIIRGIYYMWIKQVKKTNSPKGKVFYQYQLTETYRIGKLVRHKSILYLGYHSLLKEKENRRKLAKLLESRIREAPELSEEFIDASIKLKELADEYYRKYLEKNSEEEAKETDNKVEADRKIKQVEYTEVDISTTETYEAKEIGAEAISYKMLERLELKELLERKGWTKKWIDYAMISIISKVVFASSERKTEEWIKQNSGVLELFNPERRKITRHSLYKVSSMLYDLKDEIEGHFYRKETDMFNLNESLLIYDLTNTHFEGRKDKSNKARYGKNKQKRDDCKQIVLAGVINEYGFLKYSQIYEGNIGEPETLEGIINKLKEKAKGGGEGQQRRTIVMDAGIATEDNLKMLTERGERYISVSRSKLKDYEGEVKEGLTKIKDKQGNEIQMKIIRDKAKADIWMYVKSKMKGRKESSMLEASLKRYEKELEAVKRGIEKKGGTKTVEKVYERIGRIKERNRRANRYYEIEIKAENGKVKEFNWRKKEQLERDSRDSGVYFIRTNYQAKDEKELWEAYNTIREVESAFRCLKTDLKLRPNFHQKDEYVEAHINLGLLAYHIVSSIRYMLKSSGINYDWQNIVRIMNTQKAVTIRQELSGNRELTMRVCSRPTQKALAIYKTLRMSSIPFRMKKYVVHH